MGRLYAGEFTTRSAPRRVNVLEGRIARYTERLEANGSDGGNVDEGRERSAAWRPWRRWRRELLDAERETLLALRDEGEVGPEAVRRIERDLDLEESRFAS